MTGATKFSDLVAKAHAQGFADWGAGVWDSPYSSAELRAAWIEGWNQAQAKALGQRVEPPAEDGIYGDVPDTAYHADPHSLSSSGARALLQPGGPAKFKYAPRVEKAEYDFGHVAHALILGEGSAIEVIDADSWRTKDAKAARDKARAEGKVPVLRATFKSGEQLAQAAKTHPLGELLFAEGVPEQSAYWHDEQTGVRLRCRPDWITGGDRPFQVDVKTTKSAAPQDFAKSIADYGYHQQQAFYVDGLAARGVQTEFLFFAVEVTYPYLCSVIELPHDAVALGRSLNRAAIDLYADCTKHDHWPGYPEVIHRVALPDWVYRTAESTLRRLEGTTAA